VMLNLHFVQVVDYYLELYQIPALLRDNLRCEPLVIS
jgi:hypothetical protein